MKFETSDNLQTYIHEINKYRQLTKGEELELALRIRQNPDDETAVNALVQANLKFVITLANKFIGQNVPILDLINAGNIGMIVAAKKFNPEKNVRFITYAALWIRKYLNGEIANHSKIVKLPMNQEYQLYKDRKAGLDVNTRTVEIDKPINSDSDNTIGDIMLKTSTEDQHDRDHTAYQAEKVMSVLTPEEKAIIKLRYGFDDEDGLSNKEIAERLNVPIAQVGRVMRTARNKMKERAQTIVD